MFKMALYFHLITLSLVLQVRLDFEARFQLEEMCMQQDILLFFIDTAARNQVGSWVGENGPIEIARRFPSDVNDFAPGAALPTYLPTTLFILTMPTEEYHSSTPTCVNKTFIKIGINFITSDWSVWLQQENYTKFLSDAMEEGVEGAKVSLVDKDFSFKAAHNFLCKEEERLLIPRTSFTQRDAKLVRRDTGSYGFLPERSQLVADGMWVCESRAITAKTGFVARLWLCIIMLNCLTRDISPVLLYHHYQQLRNVQIILGI